MKSMKPNDPRETEYYVKAGDVVGVAGVGECSLDTDGKPVKLYNRKSLDDHTSASSADFHMALMAVMGSMNGVRSGKRKLELMSSPSKCCKAMDFMEISTKPKEKEGEDE